MRQNSAKLPLLNLQILTWEKDSHGLYDYEATKHRKQFFQIQGPCKVFRDWPASHTSILSNDKIKKGIIPEDNYSFLASINLKHNGNFQQFILNTPQQPSQDIPKKDGQQTGFMNTNTYVVVRYYKGNHKNSGFPIIPSNILKLGRVEFRVVQIGGLPKIKGGKRPDNLLGQFNGIHKAQQEVEGTCKFCLCDDTSEDNYLISPCKCKGSCEGVHVQCLKMWIDSKVKKQVNGVVVSYNFTKFECQLCKEPFPRIVTKSGADIEMISIEKPKKPYLIIEGINERKESKQQRCLHVLCPEDGAAVKIGRGHQCQIRLQDISVSRMHSQIKYSNGQFFLSDQNSKFGTLVRLDKQVQLNHRIKLQAGRSLYQFSVQ